MRPTSQPVSGAITMVVPTKITDLCVYVKLIEYNNIEGFIILADLSKSRIKSMAKVVKIGKEIAAAVQTVSSSITLSKKIVLEAEEKKCRSEYRDLKYIHGIIGFFVKKLQKEHNITLDTSTACDTFIWCLSTDVNVIMCELKLAVDNFDKVYHDKLNDVDPILIQCYRDVLALKLQKKDVLLEAILEVSCFEPAGINITKSVLLKAESMATVSCPFKVTWIKTPFCSITIKTKNQIESIAHINTVIEFIKTSLESQGANCTIIKAPEIVTEKEILLESDDDNNDE